MTLDWQDEAVCKNEDPEVMFPVAMPGTDHYLFEVAGAKAVCARCPVTSECLAYALRGGMEYGVWGGVDEVERRALSTGRRR